MCLGGVIGCGSTSIKDTTATPAGAYSLFVHAASGNVTQDAVMLLYVK